MLCIKLYNIIFLRCRLIEDLCTHKTNLNSQKYHLHSTFFRLYKPYGIIYTYIYIPNYLYFNLSVNFPNDTKTQCTSKYNIIGLNLFHCELCTLATNNLKLKKFTIQISSIKHDATLY